MASSPLFTLSRKGLLRGVGERIDRLMAYYLASNRSQSELYTGVKSLQSTIQLHSADTTRLQEAVQADLIGLFTPNFDDVAVTVTLSDTTIFDNSYRMTITMDIIVWDAGTPYSVGKELETMNGVVQSMITLNNTGQTR